jgi:hypothetical protein
MKIMEIYGFIEPGRIAHIRKKKGDYRSVVMDYYSEEIKRFDSVLRFETRFDKVTRNNMGKETKDSKLPPARRTSPRKTEVEHKLADDFEEEGTKDSKLPPARKTSPRITVVEQKLAGDFEEEGTKDSKLPSPRKT